MWSHRRATVTTGLPASRHRATMRSVSWPSSCRDCGGGIFVPALVALLTLLGWAAPVRAAPRLDRFYLPVLQNPEFPTRGPDGAVWFTVDHALARVSADGKVTLHPTPGLEPVIPTAGPDGAVWFIGNNAGAVGRIGPDGAFTTFRRGLSNVGRVTEIPAGPGSTP